jgi:hypothetical protein
MTAQIEAWVLLEKKSTFLLSNNENFNIQYFGSTLCSEKFSSS